MELKNLFYHRYLGGQHGGLEIPAGHSLRLTDVEGGANASLLLFNPRNPLERINLPDTLKCQHTFKLTAGNCVYSDMGRIFCSIVQDDTGWIDSVGGLSNKNHVAKVWGERNYQSDRNDWLQNGHDAMLVEMAKFGLGLRDLAATLNVFSKVETTDDGQLTFVQRHSKAASVVELRFEMDTIVLFSTCPHPMNEAVVYPRNPVDVEMVKSSLVEADDACLNHCDENRRGFLNTRQYQPVLVD
ncbi:urea carboxylase [Enterovibrio norvegicus FF-33]|uniref:urea amidolyase associated protein UAAP1 n=1 Tax=Enterovibrio norvegicus TaxID=188144 RepID=UPI00031FE824|nr:urea amidolyase associated protein UAAP1 [Enterovibrio norvegicus]OEE67059.1 urea carboxylase [Enterovibrio norvegicus FF-33]OEE81658.1 urea carboxylase [Enterovibrio norvegicus FF-162]